MIPRSLSCFAGLTSRIFLAAVWISRAICAASSQCVVEASISRKRALDSRSVLQKVLRLSYPGELGGRDEVLVRVIGGSSGAWPVVKVCELPLSLLLEVYDLAIDCPNATRAALCSCQSPVFGSLVHRRIQQRLFVWKPATGSTFSGQCHAIVTRQLSRACTSVVDHAQDFVASERLQRDKEVMGVVRSIFAQGRLPGQAATHKRSLMQIVGVRFLNSSFAPRVKSVAIGLIML